MKKALITIVTVCGLTAAAVSPSLATCIYTGTGEVFCGERVLL